MAINAYLGRPGSGKSYSVVSNVILPALTAGRRIVTNIPLNLDQLRVHYPDANIVTFSKPDEFHAAADLHHNEANRGAVFVVDECWRYFPAGARTNDLPEALRSFIAEHRHFVGADGRTTEICLVTQSLYQLAPFARELIDTSYVTSKLDKVGRKGSFRVDVYSGPVNLNKPDPDRLVNQLYGSYKAEIWRFYVSHTHNDATQSAGLESGADSRNTIWRSPLVRIGLPVALVALALSVWQLSRFLDPSRFHDDPVTLGEPSTVPSPVGRSGAPVAVPPAPGPHVSDRFRLVGILYGDRLSRGVAVLRDMETGTDRTIPMAGACSQLPQLPSQWECRYFGELVTHFSGKETRRNTLLGS